MLFRTVIFSFLLVGCSVFAPKYLQDADIRTTEAYEKISTLLAQADLGQLENRNSYGGVSIEYAEIIGQLETVRLAFSSNVDSTSDGLVTQSTNELNSVIDSCIELVKLFAKEHENAGIVAASGITQTVRVACDQAVRAVRATM